LALPTQDLAQPIFELCDATLAKKKWNLIAANDHSPNQILEQEQQQ
jgi:hypothetical protein